MSPRLAQDMIDGLTSAGVAQPIWPNFESMGFRRDEAGQINALLKSFELDRQTSIPGIARHATDSKRLQALTTAMDSVLAGRTPTLTGLSPAQSQTLKNATRLGPGGQLEIGRSMLELQLSVFVTDEAADLIDGNPAVTQAGMETAIKVYTRLLSQADDVGSLLSIKEDCRSVFGLLRELAVLDPAVAHKSGSAFAKALRETEQRVGARLLD